MDRIALCDHSVELVLSSKFIFMKNPRHVYRVAIKTVGWLFFTAWHVKRFCNGWYGNVYVHGRSRDITNCRLAFRYIPIRLVWTNFLFNGTTAPIIRSDRASGNMFVDILLWYTDRFMGFRVLSTNAGSMKILYVQISMVHARMYDFALIRIRSYGNITANVVYRAYSWISIRYP